ncbi:uncharacterized protein LOC131438670 [Malaya genurostris]|uniref:uncharacterized protein LOC131438670 n=1 Tax=Malaya genurostris TaxID=325434 RepID=UPI0026F38988|nr:uncharacterized protein LOC131438670 [Malaya genurostris]
MKLLVLVFICAVAVNLAGGQCTVNIRDNLQSPEPVFFRSSQLWSPDGAALMWNSGESSAISCQSGQINGFDTSNADITCQSGTSFTIGGTSVDSSALTCTQRITGEIDITSNDCANGAGQLRNIGFRTADGQLVTYIQSCYNVNRASVIYTRHIIPGRAINYAIQESYRPSFKVAGTADHVSPATSYTTAQQSIRLANILGSQEQADKFITSSSYMSRGHLAPDADGIFRPWQWATYFYVNVAPQWQVVNAGNWLIIEGATRNIAGRLKEDVIIFNGAHDVMTLPHVNGQQIPITLEDGGIEAPKWYWKIIKSPGTNSGIALITNNDPFRTSISSDEMMCSDVCSAYGWDNVNYANFARGYTYCCTVADLMSAIPAIPSDAAVSNVLHY